MLKSTILSIAAFMFLFIIWAVTPVRADCPHKENFNHKHCDNVPTESSAVSAVVTDSQGAFVGPLVESAVGGASLVLRQDVDTAVRFEVTEAGLNETSLTLNYESTNCIGPELMSPAAPNLSADGINRGTTVYYAPSGGAMFTIRSQSVSPIQEIDCPVTANRFFIPPNICCDAIHGPGGEVQEKVPASMIDLSNLVPPFQAEVRE